MPDFAAYVRRHLPAMGLPAKRYDSIVDELASELEARYSRHLDHGATDTEAWNAVIAEIPSWADLARELAAATPTNARDPEERRTRLTRLSRALSIDHWTRDVRMSWRSLRKDRGFAAAAVVVGVSGDRGR
jgi:hypothetical protein